ncbi:hypothetical protein [Tissierella pigra]|uniref:Uncharacterized protein n=1 Tax=Tissierella pigra TaxID=2607614 RepID=A0A6N7XIN2_9FIRM|nr:hypothetical protein [Tissierella pigra]MSU01931.1 hypothetical protein [Tissierella pigra]
MSKANKSPTPLSVMLGDGDSFIVKEKSYIVKPIELKDIEEFMKDNLSIDTQLFNIANEKAKEKVNRWLTGYCFDEESNPVSLEKVMDYGWNVVDLRKFFRKLCDLSG